MELYVLPQTNLLMSLEELHQKQVDVMHFTLIKFILIYVFKFQKEASQQLN